MGLRALDDPLEYYFGRELGSKTALIQMVLYVYGCMAPVTPYFTLFVFGLLAIGFRHQFIFIYPPANDSGGKLWLNYTKLSIICMIVAEIVLFAVILLKESFIAAILLVPLIVVTILFDIYFKRRHYYITKYLPLRDCAIVDSDNESRRMMNEWLKGAYLQPALKEKVVSLGGEMYAEDGMLGDEVALDLADDHKDKGNAHMSSKEYGLALQEYNQAIDLSPTGPNSFIYYSNRAAAFCYLGDYEAAASDCHTSIDLNPQYEKAHTRLGLSLYFQGDYQGAVNAYEKSLDLDPQNQSCFNYMVKAKEKMATEQRDETEVEMVESPFGVGGAFWGQGVSRSFDYSISIDD